jgi:hypothetical protein
MVFTATLHGCKLMANDLVLERLYSITNHLIKIESGAKMDIRYIQSPDLPMPKGSLHILPRTKSLAEVTTVGNEFLFDETIETNNVIHYQDITVTNMGFMVGRHTLSNSDGNKIGSQIYYWVPRRQFSFTIITNGISVSGGWIANIFHLYKDIADMIVRLCLPEIDSSSINLTESNSIAKSTRGNIIINVISNSATCLDIKVSSSDTNSYQLICYTYHNSKELFPESVDCFIYYMSNPIQIEHALAYDIITAKYLNGKETANPPKKVVDEIYAPGYQRMFEVISNEQIQIVGTNRLPIRNTPSVVTQSGPSRIAFWCLIAFSITSLVFVWKLTNKHK